MLKETDVEAALANCRALIEPFVDASSATELQFYLKRAASALKKSLSRSRVKKSLSRSRERGKTKIAVNYRCH